MASSTTSLSEAQGFLASWWRYLAVAAVAVALGLAFFAVTRSSLLRIRAVEVAGNHELADPAVVRMSGINGDTSALSLDERSVEENLLSDPWVAQVDVSISLPWTVHIDVVERIPVAVVRQPWGLFLVAADGTALEAVTRSHGLPLIVMPPVSVREGGTPALQGPASALGALSPEIRSRVRRVTITAASTLELSLDDGLRISYGTADAFARKASVIEDVLAWATSEGERYRAIDVSAPSAPAAIPAS